MLKRQWICQDSGKPRPPHISCSCRALAVSKGYSHWPFLVWKSRNVLRVFSYPPGSSVHGILQARLEWVAISYSRRSSRPRHLTQVSCIAGRFFIIWATREARRILEWVAMPSSRGSSQPRDWTHVSCIAGRFFIIWATREALQGLLCHLRNRRDGKSLTKWVCGAFADGRRDQGRLFRISLVCFSKKHNYRIFEIKRMLLYAS